MIPFLVIIYRVIFELIQRLGGLDPQHLVAIATFCAVFVALAIGLLGDKLKEIFFKPKLKVSFEMQPPYSHPVPFTNDEGKFVCDSYYFRIKIINDGTKSNDDRLGSLTLVFLIELNTVS